jgi:hypothetical protein
MYLGNIPATSFEAVKKDRFTGLTGTGVTLSHSVSDVQDVVVWVNSVKQDYNNYSVSGTALTLGGSLVSTDVVQVLYVGRTFQTVSPSADSVTSSKIADNAISEEHLDPTIITGLTALASEPADTDEFLISDAGTLKRIDYSLIKGQITEADQWRLTGTHSGVADITTNWERVDTDGFNYIGTGMTEASGIFSFPSTGIYYIVFTAIANLTSGSSAYLLGRIMTTLDNSSYDTAADAYTNVPGTNYHTNLTTSFIFDVTNTSTHKCKFKLAQNQSGTPQFLGATNDTYTSATFIKLGNT